MVFDYPHKHIQANLSFSFSTSPTTKSLKNLTSHTKFVIYLYDEAGPPVFPQYLTNKKVNINKARFEGSSLTSMSYGSNPESIQSFYDTPDNASTFCFVQDDVR